MPENTGQAIVQDSLGFIWIGTQNGLTRYDGLQFKHFKHRQADTLSLSNNQVEGLLYDSQGYLWVTTRNGLNRFKPSNHQVERYFPFPNGQDNENWLKYDLAEDRQGHIWFASFFGLFEIEDWSSKTIHYYPIAQEEKLHLCFAYDRSRDIIWVGKGTHLYQIKSGEPAERVATLNNSIFSLALNNSTLYLGTSDGLWEYSGNQLEKVPLFNSNPPELITTLVWEGEEACWIGSSSGLFLWKDSTLYNFKHQAEQSGSLSHDLVLSIYRSHEGLLWVGTGQGVNVRDPLHDQIIQIDVQHQEFFQLQENQIQAIWSDERYLAIGTAKGLLLADYGNAGVQWGKPPERQVWLGEDHLKDPSITAIEGDGNGILWLGTFTGKLHYLNLNSLNSSINLENHTFNGGVNLRSIWFDPQEQHLWLGYSNALHCLSWPEGDEQPVWWPETQVVQFGLAKNELWAGNWTGIRVLDLEAKRVKVLKSYLHPDSLPSSMLTHLLDEDSVLWISTFGGGLLRWSKARETYQYFQEEQGLENNNVWSVYADGAGRLWMSTDGGVSIFDQEKKQFRNITTAHGLGFNDHSMGAHAQLLDGSLMFGHPQGLSWLHPDHWKENIFIPDIFLSEWQLNYHPMPLDSAWKGLVLKPNDFHLRLGFSAPNFRNSQATQFSYRLEGFDQAWVERSMLNAFIDFTDLPPGNYTLQVKVGNDADQWNPEIFQLPILVLPPLYQRWWFQLLVALMLVVVSSTAIFWYNRRAYQKTIQQLKMQQRIQSERERISQDLHDHVGAHLTRIITDIDLIQLTQERDSADLRNEKLEQTRRFTFSTIQLLRDTIWALHKDRYSLEEWVEQVEQFLSQFLSGRIEWKLEKQLTTHRELSPQQLLNLLRILQEATQNMMKHSEATYFHVCIESTADACKMTIIDNGRGTSAPLQSGNAHYGLNNMRKRAADIGARLNMTSREGHGFQIEIVL